MHTLTKETIIDRPLKEVFDFFSKAENLNQITPPDMQFQILTPLPINIQKGTLIDYKIKVNGIPFKWKTLISTWEPPFRFVDEQLKGPYNTWIHEHTFEERDGKTYMKDVVKFKSPGWILEPLINALFIEKKVKGIFDYREKRLNEFFK
ncbi:MAG: SRPBCC family protein [Bacteroidetes bacterium]|nr:SRPBCC family protein [Bacteroidota bacterium]